MRRFAASVTGFANKYREDQFVRTEVTIVVLQVVLALVLLTVVWFSFRTLEEHLAGEFIARVVEEAGKQEALTFESARMILEDLKEVQKRSLVAIIATIILTSGLFGYIVARFALMPTRNALESQKQFIGNVAHELRTPLSVIKTNTEVALMDKHEVAAERIFKSTVEELDRISSIIDNLLSLSALTRPEKIEFSDVDVGRSALSALKKLEPLAAQKKHTVSVRNSGNQTAWGNDIALEQVFINILKNAMNYTPEGGRIEVSIDGSGYTVDVTVKDNGIGIAESEVKRIFDPFYRVEQSRSRISGSSGLGLTIVNELVRLHNGRISVESKPGKGTSVRVSLMKGNGGRTRRSRAPS